MMFPMRIVLCLVAFWVAAPAGETEFRFRGAAGPGGEAFGVEGRVSRMIYRAAINSSRIVLYFSPTLGLYFLVGPDVFLEGGFQFMMLLGFALLLFMLFSLFIVINTIKRAPALGLYEKGVQVQRYRFLPYEEISEVDTTMEGWGWWKEESVDLFVKYKSGQRWWKSPPRYMSLPKWFLKAEGLQELKDQVDIHNE